MKWLSAHDFIGTEFDFLLCDASGRLGYFSSAGFGPIPQIVAKFGDEMYALCEEIEHLEKVSMAEELSSEPNIGEWVFAAERGFYAYDWSHENKRYEIVARPRAPLRLHDLVDGEMRRVIQGCQFEGTLGEAVLIADDPV